MKSNEKIKAIKEGKIKLFSITIWQNLPKDKLGWQPYAEMPNDVFKHLEFKSKASTEGEELNKAKEFFKENIVIKDEPINLLNEGLEIKDSEEMGVKKRGRKPKAI